MFNPFHPFTDPLLDAFVQHGKRYFVRQTYRRGVNALNEGIKGAYLISHYDDLNKAQAHYNALASDPNRFLYDWNNTGHQQKLKVAASSPAGYKVYSCTLERNWERHITDRIKKGIRLYVTGLGWQPSRSEGLNTKYFQIFGELYIQLKYKTREVKVKFEEIENLS
jgi:hypothetical protein